MLLLWHITWSNLMSLLICWWVLSMKTHPTGNRLHRRNVTGCHSPKRYIIWSFHILLVKELIDLWKVSYKLRWILRPRRLQPSQDLPVLINISCQDHLCMLVWRLQVIGLHASSYTVFYFSQSDIWCTDPVSRVSILSKIPSFYYYIIIIPSLFLIILLSSSTAMYMCG